MNGGGWQTFMISSPVLQAAGAREVGHAGASVDSDAFDVLPLASANCTVSMGREQEDTAALAAALTVAAFNNVLAELECREAAEQLVAAAFSNVLAEAESREAAQQLTATAVANVLAVAESREAAQQVTAAAFAYVIDEAECGELAATVTSAAIANVIADAERWEVAHHITTAAFASVLTVAERRESREAAAQHTATAFASCLGRCLRCDCCCRCCRHPRPKHHHAAGGPPQPALAGGGNGPELQPAARRQRPCQRLRHAAGPPCPAAAAPLKTVAWSAVCDVRLAVPSHTQVLGPGMKVLSGNGLQGWAWAGMTTSSRHQGPPTRPRPTSSGSTPAPVTSGVVLLHSMRGAR